MPPHDDRQPPRLDDWCVIMDTGRPYLTGEVWGHPLIADGRTIITSPIPWIAAGRSAARTQNRQYQLGRERGDGPP